MIFSSKKSQILPYVMQKTTIPIGSTLAIYQKKIFGQSSSVLHKAEILIQYSKYDQDLNCKA